MEPRFGQDFSQVRVHTDGRAADSARAVNALAYTAGHNIVFGATQYNPGTTAGRHLLAHEIAHVVQQGSLAATYGGLRYGNDPSQEVSADAAANAIVAGRTPSAMPGTISGAQLQRTRIDEDELSGLASESAGGTSLTNSDALSDTGGLSDLLPSLPSLPSLPPPCTPARSSLEARALHVFVLGSYLPFSRGMFGPQTTGLWLNYLDTSLSLPRPSRSFTGSGEIVDGFTRHHKSAEAEKEIVDASAAVLNGTARALLPVPGTNTTVPLTSVVPATSLQTRINNDSDPMGLRYDSPATTIPGNIAGGIGDGGPPGNTARDQDTRGVDGTLQLALDAAGTNLTITPALTFQVHDTVDFCPGNLGGTLARVETVPMSILEATEGRFGPIFAADVPFDVAYPGPGTAQTSALGPAPPTPPPTHVTDCEPMSGDVAGERILFKVNTVEFLTSAEQAKFDTIADSLSAGSNQVKVHGFASVDGPADLNDRLSCMRALRAAQLLRDRGVPGSRITDIFKHGETPGPAQERRSVVFELVSSGPGPGPTPVSAAVRLKSMRFLSDHHLMKDNLVDWEKTGKVFPKPEWQPTNPGSRSAPISHDRNASVVVELVYDAASNAPSGVPFTLIGQSAQGFLTFNASGALQAGNDQILAMASSATTPNAIEAFPGQAIAWSIQLPTGQQPLGTVQGLDAFITMAPPRRLDEVTYRRMAKAVELTGSIHTLDPHELVHGIMLNFGAYNLDVQYDNAWKMADNIPLGAQCIDIVRFVMGLIETVGCPGVGEAKLIWARPTEPGRAVETNYLGGDSLHNYPPHPTHPTWGAALIDANACPNNFEAALKFTFGDTRYYPGGVPLIDQVGWKVIFTSPQQVLEIFQYLAWIEGVSKKTWIARDFLISYSGRRTDLIPFVLVCDSKVLP